jgi:hypothetical protein
MSSRKILSTLSVGFIMTSLATAPRGGRCRGTADGQRSASGGHGRRGLGNRNGNHCIIPTPYSVSGSCYRSVDVWGLFRTRPQDHGALRRAGTRSAALSPMAPKSIAEAANRTVRERDESMPRFSPSCKPGGRSAMQHWRAARSTPSSSLARCARFASEWRAFAACRNGISSARALSRRIPCLFRGPSDVAHGVLAGEAM